MSGGAGKERLGFFIMILFLMCHLIACIWIFVGEIFDDNEVDGDTWIEGGNYKDLKMFEVYALSCYFTM
jgi:hypothetical protein